MVRKKITLPMEQPEQQSINLLDFCPDIVDMILQHFNVQQILSLSESSRGFWEFTLTYKKFMKNVKLKIDSNRKVSDKEFSVFIKRINRNYQNFDFDGTEMIAKMPLLTKNHKVPVKSVKITNMIFNRPTLLQNFINANRNSMEELVITSVFIFNCDKKIEISLPHLKHLEMIECNDQENTFVKRISFVIGECEHLESINLVYSGVSEENQKRLLFNNEKLKSLSLSELKDSFFDTIDIFLTFKLEKFVMNFPTDVHYRAKPNFTRFLQSQSNNLLKVELNGWISPEALEIIYKMPKLNSLTISRAETCFRRISSLDVKARLRTNSSLRELTLTDNVQQSLWHLFLKNSPNLNRFQLFNSSYSP